MKLIDLAAAQPFALPLNVPAWTLGAFHRRCITYATGAEDVTSRVIWVQSHGMTGDLRIPAWRPDVTGKAGLEDCSVEALALLAASEGGVARTGWSGEWMDWSGWAAFQPYDKWPEPGKLHRIGTCLIETPPSEIYVEDWRLQPGGDGLLAGLRLVSETGADGVARARDGGIVIAGEHAIFVLDRRSPIAEGVPVARQILQAADPRALAAAAFDFTAAYARRDASGDYVAQLAVNPFDEGQVLPITDGFRPGQPGHLLQQVGDIERLWAIDTLVMREAVGLATPASADGTAWLAREGGVLLRTEVA
jgi:hypothetical protein